MFDLGAVRSLHKTLLAQYEKRQIGDARNPLAISSTRGANVLYVCVCVCVRLCIVYSAQSIRPRASSD